MNRSDKVESLVLLHSATGSMSKEAAQNSNTKPQFGVIQWINVNLSVLHWRVGAIQQMRQLARGNHGNLATVQPVLTIERQKAQNTANLKQR